MCATKTKQFIAAFAGTDQVGTSSNAVLLVTASQKLSGTNVVISGKITGVWVDGFESGAGEAITAPLATAKVK